jgi:hypothetical protein
MISALLDPFNAGERLSSYIDLPKRLGCPAFNPDRLCCLQATSRLPRATWRSLEEPGGAYIHLQWWGWMARPEMEFLTESTRIMGSFAVGGDTTPKQQQRRTDGRRRLMGPPDDGRRAAFLWEPVRRLRPAIRPNSPVRAGRRLHQFPRSPLQTVL